MRIVIKVWTTPDPEASLTQVPGVVVSFANRLGSTFPGDFAHFLSTKTTAGGGLSGIAILPYATNPCDRKSRFAVSQITNSYGGFPTYSWNVHVVAHELGHNLSSPHTHSCLWPGGPIDNCAPVEDGECQPGPAPSNGGTIMSYCQNTSYGVNFLNGFGPLPGQKIREFVAQLDCPVDCQLTATMSKQDVSCGQKFGTASILVTGAQGNLTYLWNDGQRTATAVNLSPGSYYVTATDGMGCDITKNVEIRNAQTGSASVNISSSVTNAVCAGSFITYTATPVNGGSSPIYQWKVNGVNVGTNSATYVTNNLTNGDVVSVVMASSVSCVINPVATSNNVIAQILDKLVPAASITVSPSGTQCVGTSRSFTAGTNVSNGVYQWFVNGNVVGSNNASYITNGLASNDQVSVRVDVPTGGCYNVTSAMSNVIAVQNSPMVTPLVSINPLSAGMCEGSMVTLAATCVNGGSSPVYQWKVNDVNVGLNSSSYTTTSLKNGDVIKVVMTSNASCISASHVESAPISISTTLPLVPSVSISSNVTGSVCMGTSTTYTGTPVNGGSNPSYQWKVNGVNVGTNSATYVTNNLTNGDVVSVAMASSISCVTNAVTISNNVTAQILDRVVPTASLIVSPSGVQCAGTNRNFTVSTNISKGVYHWFVNGKAVSGNSASYITNGLTNNDQVSVGVDVPAGGCYNVTSVTSNVIPLQVTPLQSPTVVISSSDTNVHESNPAIITVANPSKYLVYTLYKDLVSTGISGTSFNNIVDDGEYRVLATPTSGQCWSQSSYISNKVTLVYFTKELKIYPNPVQSVLTLDGLNKKDNWESCEVYNSAGQLLLVLNVKDKRNITIPVYTYKSGVYFLKLKTTKVNAKSRSLTFIKQ